MIMRVKEVIIMSMDGANARTVRMTSNFTDSATVVGLFVAGSVIFNDGVTTSAPKAIIGIKRNKTTKLTFFTIVEFL